VSGLFWLLGRFRKTLIVNNLESPQSKVPVIVVGNITLGGTGKTPLLMALVKQLQQAGMKPGVISRGYGRQSQEAIVLASPSSTASDLGDEPYMIYHTSDCPLAVGRDRNAVLNALLASHDCDVILSDDGLQHYRLPRQLEIAVVDGSRGLGNHLCLPAGPLREPPSRLKEVDFVVVNGEARDQRPLPVSTLYGMTLVPERWHAVDGKG